MPEEMTLQENPNNPPASAEELATAIQELEQYRDRLVTDMENTAKKAKIKKSQMMGVLQPDLDKIDQALDALRTQQANTAS